MADRRRRKKDEGVPAVPASGLAGLPEPMEPAELAELTELAALRGWLALLPRSELNRLADDCPRRIPPKRRRNLPDAILTRWLEPEARRFLQGALRQAFARLTDAVRREGVRMLPTLRELLPPAAAVWVCLEAGLPVDRTLRHLSKGERGRLAEELRELAAYRDELRRRREERRGRLAAEKARANAERSRLAKALRWQAERAEAKRARAEHVVTERAREVERLRKDLTEARARIAALEEERRILLDQIAELSRRPPPPPSSSPRPLADRLILVVGDEGRQAEYRQLVLELGGRFEFLSGFGSPTVLGTRARAADLVVFVTAYASHKMWEAARRTPTPVLPVNQAGVRALRDALLRHLAGGPDEDGSER